MKKVVLAVFVILVASSLFALPGTDRCPPYIGTFHLAARHLTVTIVKINDKDVTPRSEEIANPLGGVEAEAVAKRGAVQFNAHTDEKSGHLFVHWDSIQPAK
jgi:hypothetical protein